MLINRFATLMIMMAADNGANGGGGAATTEPETSQAEGTETKTRKPSVADAVIIEAYLEAINNVDDEGNIVSTLEDVAEACDMNPGSLNGRLTSLRKMLGKDKFPKLRRRPSTGKTRKKDPADVLALFNKINSELNG